jgi:branched-chain amino acid transport system permease protein
MDTNYYEYIVLSLINSLSFGLLLFLLSAGLVLVLSMLGFLNIAHTSFYMFGAYVAYTCTQYLGFWVALLLAPIAIGFIALLLEKCLLSRLSDKGVISEILVTFGIAYIVSDLVQLVWGRNALILSAPKILNTVAFTAFGMTFPAYKLFMMLAAATVLLGLYIALHKTRLGLMVQACLTQPDMLQALGHNVPHIFTGVFAGGAALAAFAGVVAAPAWVLDPAMATTIGSIVFVVVVVGGMGSLGGAFVAALLIACLQTFAVGLDFSCLSILRLMGFEVGVADLNSSLYSLLSLKLSQFSPILPYVLLVLILVFRPHGLLGRPA